MNEEASAESLGTIFRRLIASTGPISLMHYMGEANARYYGSRDPLGAGGDFITAPEISQLFGELIGLWCAHEWDVLGKPALNWIELGPGRGVLMQDALRATAAIEGFHDAAQITLVETSPALRAAQAERVANADWAERLDDAPPGASLMIGNEFLDCMPIRQFVLTEEGWREKLVGLNQADTLTFGLSAPLPAPETDDEPGVVREIAPGLETLVYELERRLHAAPGRALFIDYGYAKSEGFDTLQALKRHKHADPLGAPGEADLTAHVDFGQLAHLAHHRLVERLVAVPVADPWHQLLLRVLARRVADLPLLRRQQPLDQQRVGPVELAAGQGNCAMVSHKSSIPSRQTA